MLNVLLVFSIVFNSQQASGPGDLTDPPTKQEETQKFHLPKVKGMSAEERLKGYAARIELEKTSPFGQMKWRNVGPESQSGRVIAAGSPFDKPEQLFVAFATGGLWRTDNDGASWTSLFDHESSFAIGDFALGADGKTIWVGTGENNSQRTRYSGTGIFKSVNSGKTWQNMGLHDSFEIGRIVMHPKDLDTVYVAVIGHVYSESAERGVYKTTDGGKTWQHVLKFDDPTGVIDLVMDPRNPNVLFAAAWNRDRRAWNFRASGPGGAVYKSTDAGKTWKKVLAGLPEGEALGRTGLAISSSNSKVVYAFIDNFAADPDSALFDERTPSGVLTLRRFLTLNLDEFLAVDKAEQNRFLGFYGPSDSKPEDVIQKLKDKKMTLTELYDAMKKRNPAAFTKVFLGCRVYRSEDGGNKWADVSGRMGSFGGYYEGRITVNPTDANDVWVTGVPLLRSMDGGKTWKEVPGDQHVDHHVVWIDPRNPKRVLDGNDGGPYLSIDGGENWRHLNNLPTGQVTTLGVDNKVPYNVYCGMQDNGTMRGPATYVAGRSDKSLWKTLAGGDGSAIAVDPRDDGDTVYVASQFGSHSAINQKTNERWGVRAPDVPGMPALRYNWISPIFISPHHPDIIYLGSHMLHRSLSQGRKYEQLSGDLTKNKPNGDVPFSTLTTIAESPFQFGLLYVGADDGTVKMTSNHGSTWVDIATPQPDKWVTRIVASKWDKATVYCCQNGYRQDDFAPYVWKSTDYGKTWKSIAGDLPNECINTVREDPNKQGLLYVGTDLGVFVTYDDGAHWDPLVGNLPHIPVHDLVIQARDKEIVIGTHARSCWIASLNDVYDLTPALRAKDLFLWPISDMPRSKRWGYDRRDPWDKTPPSKPSVRGRFWSGKAGDGIIRIKSKDGKVLKEKKLEVTTGYNGYEIDLELTPATESTIDPKKFDPKTAEEKLKDPLEATRAKYLLPGEYKIELTVNGKTVVEDWKLVEQNDSAPVRRGRRSDDDSDHD